jgi:hypothetical protein
MSPNHPHSAIDRFHTPVRAVYTRGSSQVYQPMQSILESNLRDGLDFQSRDYDATMNNNYRSTRNSVINANNQSCNELRRSNVSNRSFIDSVHNVVDQREKTTSCQTVKSKEYFIEKLKFENQKLLKKIHDMKKKESSFIFGGQKVNTSEMDQLRTANSNLNQELVKLRSEMQTSDSMIVRVRKLEAENVRLNKEVIQIRSEREQLVSEIDIYRLKSEQDISVQSNEFQNLEINNNKLRELLRSEQKRGEVTQKNLLMLQSERHEHKSEIERLKEECSINSERLKSITKLQTDLSNLEIENRKLNKLLNESQAQTVLIISEREAKIEKTLKSEIEVLKNQIIESSRSKESLQIEMEKMRSNLLKFEVEKEFSQKRVIVPQENLSQDSSKDRIAELFKAKLEEKTKENNELNILVEGLKNENHELKCQLTEKEVLSSMQSLSNNRKEKENIELMAISNEELKLQNTFLSKENEKIKDILKRVDHNRISKTEIYRTIHEVDNSQNLIKSPHLEALIMKAVLSDFELFRLKVKIEKFESEINLMNKSQNRQSPHENQIRRLHYKEVAHDESKSLNDVNSFAMLGDQ